MPHADRVGSYLLDQLEFVGWKDLVYVLVEITEDVLL